MPSRSGTSEVKVAATAILDFNLPRPLLRPILLFTVASFFAVAIGCWVARSVGVASGVWIRNLVAWTVGVAVAWLLTLTRPRSLANTVLLVAPLALAASLFSPGNSGVHRWVSLGPLSLNASFLILPAATVAFAATNRPRWAIWAAMFMQAVLILQPDASQATSLATAVCLSMLVSPYSRRFRLAASVLLLLALLLAWTRPDPLTPVPEVEGILQLTANVSKGLLVLCIAVLVVVAGAPLSARKCPPALPVTAYLLTCMLTPLFGAFPVPLVGMGMSPILGFWLAIGMLPAACGGADLQSR